MHKVKIAGLLILLFYYHIHSHPNTHIRNSDQALETLMYNFGTDKSKDDHSYSDMYAMIFDPIKYDVKKVLEVGIASGQSLQTWYYYFPNAKIIGTDIELKENVKKTLDQHKPRLEYHVKDVLQEGVLETLKFEKESFDIVIEDSEHVPQVQEPMILKLWHLVKPGGYYIIEDISNTFSNSKQFFQENPALMKPETRKIFEENHAVFVDTHIGHRAWDKYVLSSRGWSRTHTQHNCYMMIIRKRTTPLHPIQINFGSTYHDTGAN